MAFTYDTLLTYEENRGFYLNRAYRMKVGAWFESMLGQYDPDPKAEHLGTGGVVDYRNSTYCFEQKISPATDNHSSRKQNLIKGKQYAQDNDLEFVYAYLEDKPKNMYVKDGVLHVHGSALFELLGVPEKYSRFKHDLQQKTEQLIQQLRNEFDQRFGFYQSEGQVV
jgi:hypothetical protein